MADLGGDYLDTFQLDDEKFVMVLGDVAGHGVGAAGDYGNGQVCDA